MGDGGPKGVIEQKMLEGGGLRGAWVWGVLGGGSTDKVEGAHEFSTAS